MMNTIIASGTAAFFLGVDAVCALADAAEGFKPEVVSVRKIWDQGEHNAFTDLIRFRDRWWCTFREAKDHGGCLGKVRVIVSEDGEKWQSAALLEQAGLDLRDPKLSIRPEGRLMLIMRGSVYDDAGVYRTRAPRVAFSEDGYQWTEPQKLLAEDHWLWRVTWNQGWAWSVSKLGEGADPRRGVCQGHRFSSSSELPPDYSLIRVLFGNGPQFTKLICGPITKKQFTPGHGKRTSERSREYPPRRLFPCYAHSLSVY